MEEFQKIIDFVDLAEKNRKYPANTAHGRRAALHLFETVLNQDEKESLPLIEKNMHEIYLSLISKHKDGFSIKSLATYKGRFLKVIQDYKRYGQTADGISKWEAKQRGYTLRNIKDTLKDTSIHNLSSAIHTGVHKLAISLDEGKITHIEIPAAVTQKDISRIKHIIDALGKN